MDGFEDDLMILDDLEDDKSPLVNHKSEPITDKFFELPREPDFKFSLSKVDFDQK